MVSQVNLRIPAQTEYIQPLRRLGEKLLSIWIPKQGESQEATDLLLALQETMTNVIRHGYNGQAGKIEVDFRFGGSTIEIEIRDWGVPFDPSKVPLPDFETPTPGGYGVFIVKEITDHIEYRREGKMNISLLRKDFPGGSEEKKESR